MYLSMNKFPPDQTYFATTNTDKLLSNMHVRVATIIFMIQHAVW